MASTDVSFVDDGQARAAIANVRSNSDPSNWVLFNFNAPSSLEFSGNGSGGVDELKSHLNNDKISYGLVRVDEKIDESVTVKFFFIIWCGSNVKFMQKAKMTTIKGSVVSLIGQYHNDLYATSLDEISHEIIMKKITDASGHSNRVLEKTESSAAPTHTPAVTTSVTRAVPATGSSPAKSGNSGYRPKVAQGPVELTIADQEAGQAALADVRSDSSDTNWALFGYTGANSISLVGKGSGGLSELTTHFKENGVNYALLRVADTIDNSVTVKFVLILWVGDKVPSITKARIATHKGAVTEFFGQTHTDVNCSNHSELTEDIIYQKISDASGSGNRVIDKSAGSTAGHKKLEGATRPSVPKTSGSGSLQFVNEEASRNAFKAVRSDKDSTDWALLTYEGNTNNIALLGSGSGGLSELLGHLKEDLIVYGLLRTTDVYDNTVTVKFVLVWWIGEKVATTRKARITTHKGEVVNFIGQYHVDVQASNFNEINEDIVKKLVQTAAGTAIHVK